jgi:hypothetical protein
LEPITAQATINITTMAVIPRPATGPGAAATGAEVESVMQ